MPGQHLCERITAEQTPSTRPLIVLWLFAPMCMVSFPPTILNGDENGPVVEKIADALPSSFLGAENAIIEEIRLDFESGRKTRQETIDLLLHMAKGDSPFKVMGGVELDLLVLVADDDSVVRQHLLDIFTSAEVSDGVRSHAAQILKYFLDDSSRTRMLQQIKRQWQEDRSYPVEAVRSLVEHGDRDTLAWLDEQLESMSSDDPYRSHFEHQAGRIRLANDLPALLAVIENENSRSDDRRFAIRQALRQGVSHADIRRRVLRMMNGLESEEHRGKAISGVAVLCDEAGIFTAEDKRNNETVKQALRSWAYLKSEAIRLWPDWATARVDQKKAEFYHFKAGEEIPGE